MKDKVCCPVCGGNAGEVLLRLDSLPVLANALHTSAESARAIPRAPLELRYCRACTHLFNALFDPRLVGYSPAYENALHFSPTFQQYARELAGRLVGRYGLHDKTVVEIGSGDGRFLEMLCELGAGRGVGFDPSGVAETRGRVTLVNEYFDERGSDIAPHFVCARHVLEHIAEPRPFVAMIRRLLRRRSGGGLYVEVPNGLHMVRDMGVWDLVYEHCGYYTPLSIRRLFESAGYRVERMVETYGGQFLALDLTVGEVDTALDVSPVSRAVVDAPARMFGEAVAERLCWWRRRVEEMAAQGRKVAVWGAGSKGVAFLNTVAADGGVGCVVDVNPRKRGAFVAGTGHQIVGPDELKPAEIDTILLMNPVYCGEVSALLAVRGLECAIEPVCRGSRMVCGRSCDRRGP